MLAGSRHMQSRGGVAICQGFLRGDFRCHGRRSGDRLGRSGCSENAFLVRCPERSPGAAGHSAVVLWTSGRKVMGDRVTAPWQRLLGWITFAIMAAAAVGMFSISAYAKFCTLVRQLQHQALEEP